jgi:hypothetical protein
VLTDRDGAALRHAFVLGLARQPLALPAPLAAALAARSDTRTEPALVALALVGQQARFTPPPTVVGEVPEAAVRLHADPRPPLSGPTRRALLRLARLTGRQSGATVLPIALARIAAHGRKLHPFDLPTLAPHLEKSGIALGLAERAYLVLTGRGEASAILDRAAITAENWTAHSRSVRREFLEAQRRRDPAAARALLEASFTTDPAAVRADLLGTLAVGLDADDRPLLERMAKDRAESVKRAAEALLARLTDAGDRATRIAAATACFQSVGGGGGGVMGGLARLAGLGTGRTSQDTLEVVLPRATSPTEQQATVAKLFTGVRLSEIAAACGHPAGTIAAAALDAVVVWDILFETALGCRDHGDVDVLLRVRCATAHPLGLAQCAAVAAVRPEGVDQEVAADLLASPALVALLRRYVVPDGAADRPPSPYDDGTLVATAALLPAAAMPAFCDVLGPSMHPAIVTARAYADLAVALAAEPTATPIATRAVTPPPDHGPPET